MRVTSSTLATIVLATTMVGPPRLALAQDPNHADPELTGRMAGLAARGAARSATASLRLERQLLDVMDLSGDALAKADGTIDRALTDVRAAVDPYAGATPDQRREQKAAADQIVADAQAVLEAELSSGQVAKLARAVARDAVRNLSERLTAERAAVEASGKLDVQQKQDLLGTYDAALKTLSHRMADAATLNDGAEATAVRRKLSRLELNVRSEVIEVLGAANAAEVMQAGM